MSIVVNVNGESINYPQTGDTNWGDEATDFAVQTSSALAKVGLSTGTTVDLPGTLDVTGNTTLDANLSVAGTLGISNGTASAPSLTPSGDTNTGLYSIGSDKIGFAANGIRQGEFGVGYGGFTGNIIQVVSGERSSRISTTSTSNIDAGISATIIPKYSTSKIIVIVTLTIGPGNSSGLLWDIIRNSTKIAQGTGGTAGLNSTGGIYTDAGSSAGNGFVGSSAIIVDSPSTISSTTYKIEFRSHIGSVVAINGRGADSAFSGYSTILLMELQQ